MAEFRMKNYQTVLINRLAHQVKNNLTTMRLALFNLNYLLDQENVTDRKHEQSNDFLQAVRTSLDQSIDTVSKILLATRSDKKYFGSENVIRVLFDVITQSSAHENFKIDILKNEIRVSTDSQSLQLFFKLLLDYLSNALKQGSPPINIRLSEKDERCIVFYGNFQISELSDFFENDDASVSDNSDSTTFLLLKQMTEYLRISIEIKQKIKEQSELQICFNQADRD